MISNCLHSNARLHSQNSFAAALVAAKLLRELSSRSTQRRMERELEKSAMLFEKLAHRLLSAGEEVDGARTSLLVRRPVDARAVQHGGQHREEAEAPVADAVTQAGDVLYEGRSALPLAHESDCRTILAHGVALKIVNQTWCSIPSHPPVAHVPIDLPRVHSPLPLRQVRTHQRASEPPELSCAARVHRAASALFSRLPLRLGAPAVAQESAQ